jgi:hypothetical protein
MSEEIKLPSDLVKLFKTYHDTWRRVKPIVSRVFTIARLGMLYSVMKMIGYKPSYLCEHGIARCVEFNLGTCTIYVDLPVASEYIPPDVETEIKQLPRIEDRPRELDALLDTMFGAYILIIKGNWLYGYESEVVVGKGIGAKRFMYAIKRIKTDDTGFNLDDILIRSLTSPSRFYVSLQLLIKDNSLVCEFAPSVEKETKEIALLAITDFFSKNKEEMKNALKCGVDLLAKLELPSTIYLLY